MDIYKLKDDLPEERKRRSGANGGGDGVVDGGTGGGVDGDVLKITGMKQGVKNPNRVNVYVNNEYELSLDVAQVVEYKLKVGKVVSQEELSELRKAAEYGKLYQRALEWVLLRPRSIKETEDYLYRKLKMSSSGRSSRPSSRGSSLRPRSDCGCPSEDIFKFSREIVSQLINKGYVNDKRFAEWWVENRFVKKGVSRKRLRMELRGKGISAEIIDEVLDGRDDEEELRKMIAKKASRYDDPEKLMAYLCRQGFSYDLIRKLVEENES